MNPIGITILLFLVVVVISAPRKWALLAMMAGVLYLTEGQELQVAGFNLFAMRFLELAAFGRILLRRELSFLVFNRVDRAFVLLYSFTTIVFLLRSGEGQAYQVGLAVDAFLCYFTFRALVRDLEEWRWFLRAFLILLGPYVVLVGLERVTGHNMFASMGGVADGTWLREGKVRCWGSFRHPSLLGTLGAAFAPLYIGLAFSRADRRNAFIGIGLCLAVIGLTNSGGPIGALAAGMAAWLLWRVRTRMHLVRRIMACSIVLLAMVMKAPIWYIIMHVSDITGGDGWHRAYLMDMAYQHLHQWWFDGMPIAGTHDWFPYNLPGTEVADITNQFVSFGIQAGVGAIVLCILLLTRAFSDLGRALSAARASLGEQNDVEPMLWGLGAVLTTHIVNWFGITYFDQTYVIWFMQLAVVSTLSELVIKSASEPEPSQTDEALELEPALS